MRAISIWGPGLCYLAGALCLLAGLWGWRTEPRRELVILSDVSDSLLYTRQPDTAACERALRPDRTVRFAFAGTTRLLYDSAAPASASAQAGAARDAVNDAAELQTGQTDLAQAIKAAASLPAQGAIRRRAVLVTDGRATTGDAVAAALAHALQMRLDIVPAGTIPQPDARAEGLSLPAAAKTGQPLRAEAFVSSAAPATVRLELLSPGGAVLEARQRSLTPGGSRETFDLPPADSGLQEYALRVHLSDDRVPQNDTARAAVLVEGGNTLLWIGRRPAPQGLLPSGASMRFLPPEQFHAGALTAPAAPAAPAPSTGATPTGAAPQPVAGVILDNLSARDLAGREELLADYLRRGGAALILGGDNSLAPGGWAGTPLAELLPVEVLPREQLQIVFALDVSGSMGEDNKLARAQGALQAAVDGLGLQDEAGLVLFAREAREALPLRPVQDNNWAAALRNTAAGGGTSLFAGATQALQLLQDAPARSGRRTAANRRHILLLTDGDTLEKDAARTQAAAALRAHLQEAGVGLWVIALGKEAERAFLQELTRGIGGTTFAAGQLAQLPQVLRVSLDAARGGFRRGPLNVRGDDLWTVRQTTAFGPLRGSPGDELILQAEDGFALAARGRTGLGRVLLLGGSPSADWQAGAQTNAPTFLYACLQELLRGPTLAGGLHARRAQTHLRIRWQPQPLAGGPYFALAQSNSGAAQTTPQAVALQAQAGGVWTADLPASFSGPGVVSILEGPQRRLVARGALNEPTPAEYLQFGADGQALAALALAGGGTLVFQPGQLADWDRVPVSGHGGAPVLPAALAVLFLAAGLILRGRAG